VRSACTCETCGELGRLYDHGDWLATACSEHAQGEPVPVKPATRTFASWGAWSRTASASLAAVATTPDADTFVDVDAQSLGIEE
jgi:hypothetical protein